MTAAAANRGVKKALKAGEGSPQAAPPTGSTSVGTDGPKDPNSAVMGENSTSTPDAPGPQPAVQVQACCSDSSECCGGQLCVLELTYISQGKSSASSKSCKSGNSPLRQISHNGLNRKRTQERIQKENEVIMKRIESVRPTPSLKCTEQLADYKRITAYLGGSLKNHIVPEKQDRNLPPKKASSSSAAAEPSLQQPLEQTE